MLPSHVAKRTVSALANTGLDGSCRHTTKCHWSYELKKVFSLPFLIVHAHPGMVHTSVPACPKLAIPGDRLSTGCVGRKKFICERGRKQTQVLSFLIPCDGARLPCDTHVSCFEYTRTRQGVGGLGKSPEKLARVVALPYSLVETVSSGRRRPMVLDEVLSFRTHFWPSHFPIEAR